MSYIPLIKTVKWVDLSDEHQKLRESIEKDLDAACKGNGNIQPIMLQGAFGIGKSTTLYYLFHYGWEILKTPTFYLPLSKIVDKIKEEAIKRETGKVENSQLSTIISKLIKSQIDTLASHNWDEVYNLDFPEFRGKDDDTKLSLSDYLVDFRSVKLDIKDHNLVEKFNATVFSREVILEAVNSNHTPLLLVDEFESKFYELKRYVESSGGGILRELFDEVVQTKPFMLVIGNGPASGYEVAKEKGVAGNNDSETAANRRLKTMQIPFPTVDLLKRKFMCGSPNGFVNFIWWMSRCRPGHIQKLRDTIDYDIYQNYKSSDFITRDIFNEPIDESGEEVKYLKTIYFNKLDSYIFPLIKELLLDFEPRKIQLEENYKEPLKEKDTANNFYCSDELFSVQKDLLPAIQKDICEYLTKCNSEGKYTGIDYYKNLNKYFNYILSACANSKGEMAFNTSCKEVDEALAETFLIPIFELTYDFISQYEDSEDSVVKETKDFILDCTKYIERSSKDNRIQDVFPYLSGLFSGYKIGRQKTGTEFYIQFSLRAVREIIEQPIGSPKLKYKDMSLDTRLSEIDFSEAVLVSNNYSNNNHILIFIPILEDSMLDAYILRIKEYINNVHDELHQDGQKTLKFVYFQQNEKIDSLIDDVLYDDGEMISIAKYNKLVFEDFNNYQFNFGGQISDFIDSVAKIAIIGAESNEITQVSDDNIVSITSVIEQIKNREWTKQKEVVRTIEHYEKLVRDGENAVLNMIEKDSLEKYNESLGSAICDISDYQYDIPYDFTQLYDASITDELSKYIALYYVLEKAKDQKPICETTKRILATIGSRTDELYLNADSALIARAVNYSEVSKILSKDECNSFISKYQNEDKFIQRLSTFTRSLSTELPAANIIDILTFIQDELSDHWIKSYNEKMSYYGYSKGEVLMKLLYLDSYLDLKIYDNIRNQIKLKIEEKEKELINTRTKIASAISSITEMLYSVKYAKENPDRMPLPGYVKTLSLVSGLLSQCKRALDEEQSSIAALCILWTVVSRIEKISAAATTLATQISSIERSLDQQRVDIERKYQTVIDAIYEDSLAAKLISFSEQKIQGQVPNYSGKYCWIEYAKSLRNSIEASIIFNAKLLPAKEEVLKQDDINKFNNRLQQLNNTDSGCKTRMEDAVKTCKACKAKASELNQLLDYVDELLKITE